MTMAWTVDINTLLSHLIRTKLCEQKGVSHAWNPRERSRGQGFAVSRQMLSGEKILFRSEEGSAWVKRRSFSIDHEGHTSCVKLLHTSVSPNCEMELTAPISQGRYEVTTERTALHLELGLAHKVHPHPMAAAVNVSGFLGKASVLCNEGKHPGLTSHIFDYSTD